MILSLPWVRQVQIETNGTVNPELNNDYRSKIHVTCSPKTAKVHRDTYKRADSWKYIIEEGKVDKLDGLPTASLGMNFRPARPWEQEDNPTAWTWRDRSESIFVQPLDVGDPIVNKQNMEVAVESCQRYGYRLSLQIHKIVGLA
jgi:7-carboxy-7-deazaguanine synthase